MVVVVERFLLWRYLWISELGGVFLGCWVEIECFCFLEVVLVVGLIFVLIWVIRVGLVILV